MSVRRMNPQECVTALLGCDGWESRDLGTDAEQITRSFSFPDFAAALRFVNQVGEIAEEMNHHPDIVFSWGRAKLSISTHDAGGLSEKDFEFARKVNQL